MKYCIAKFDKIIPTMDGLTIIATLTEYTIFSIDDENHENLWTEFTGLGQPWEEITEIEATQGIKFYGEVREFRKAYSYDEGLEPDEDENGKTKIYYTDEFHAATVLLMKRVFKKMVMDVYDTRDSRDGEDTILTMIDGLTTVRAINLKREELLGIEMTRTQLRELDLWDEDLGCRTEVCDYTLGF
jgi:hypothetical protein